MLATQQSMFPAHHAPASSIDVVSYSYNSSYHPTESQFLPGDAYA